MSVENTFSSQKDVSSAQEPCSLNLPAVPCNLEMLVMTENDADVESKVRRIEVRKGTLTQRNASPVILATGDTFEITAPSRYGKARKVEFKPVFSDCCDQTAHPIQINYVEQKSCNLPVEFFNKNDFKFADLGFFGVLNTFVRLASDPEIIQISSGSCGLPADNSEPSVSGINSRIAVYPADTLKFELEIPSLNEPDSLKGKKTTDSWETEQDRDEKKAKQEHEATVKQLKEEARSIYKENKENFGYTGTSIAEYEEFFMDVYKSKKGDDDKDYLDKLKINVERVDGSVKDNIHVDGIIKLVRFIRNLEYRTKTISEWSKSIRWGPGASFEFGLSFFAMKISGEAGYKELQDGRVIFAGKIAGTVDIVSGEVGIKGGAVYAGMADLEVSLKLSGKLSLELDAKKDDFGDTKGEANVVGEFKGDAKVAGKLLWVVTAEFGADAAYTAKTKDMEFFTKDKLISGKIELSRSKVMANINASCMIMGFGGEKELFKEVKYDPLDLSF